MLSTLKFIGKEGRVLRAWGGLSCSREIQERYRLVTRTCHFLINRPCPNSPWNKCYFLPHHIAYKIATSQIN